jgi:hypothetical protein
MAELQVAIVRAQVAASLHTDFENYSVFKPTPRLETSLTSMLDQLVARGGALKALREAREGPCTRPDRQPRGGRAICASLSALSRTGIEAWASVEHLLIAALILAGGGRGRRSESLET